MSVTAQRVITIQFTGDVEAANAFAAANNASSPGEVEMQRLAAGANTITPPGSGTTPVACTIIPPTGNTSIITLKGIAGDTGVALHLTDPTTIALHSTVTSFVLTAVSQVDVRLVWT